jgi:hypothetical protein
MVTDEHGQKPHAQMVLEMSDHKRVGARKQRDQDGALTKQQDCSKYWWFCANALP